MHITRVNIEGFKRFTQFELKLNPTFNVIVGDNETGKSSLLEAINRAYEEDPATAEEKELLQGIREKQRKLLESES